MNSVKRLFPFNWHFQFASIQQPIQNIAESSDRSFLIANTIPIDCVFHIDLSLHPKCVSAFSMTK